MSFRLILEFRKHTTILLRIYLNCLSFKEVSIENLAVRQWRSHGVQWVMPPPLIGCINLIKKWTIIVNFWLCFFSILGLPTSHFKILATSLPCGPRLFYQIASAHSVFHLSRISTTPFKADYHNIMNRGYLWLYKILYHAKVFDKRDRHQLFILLLFYCLILDLPFLHQCPWVRSNK